MENKSEEIYGDKKNIVGTMTLFNETGDITIAWDDSNTDLIKEKIKKKLEEGYTFFIVKKRFFGIFETKEKLIDAGVLKKGDKILVKDKEIEELFSKGAVGLINNKENIEFETDRRTANVNEIIENDTIALRPLRGG